MFRRVETPRCGSSVVEHSLGKGEVESSILSRSTSLFKHLAAKSAGGKKLRAAPGQHGQTGNTLAINSRFLCESGGEPMFVIS